MQEKAFALSCGSPVTGEHERLLLKVEAGSSPLIDVSWSGRRFTVTFDGLTQPIDAPWGSDWTIIRLKDDPEIEGPMPPRTSTSMWTGGRSSTTRPP